MRCRIFEATAFCRGSGLGSTNASLIRSINSTFDLTLGIQPRVDDIENKLHARSIAAHVDELSSVRSCVHNSMSKRCAPYRFRVTESVLLPGLSDAPSTTERKTPETQFLMTSV